MAGYGEGLEFRELLLHEEERERELEDQKKPQQPTSRYANANFISRLTYWWVNPLITKGIKGTLEESDYELPKSDEVASSYSALKAEWELELRESEKQNRPPSLVRAVRRRYFADFVRAGIYKLMWSILLMLAAFYFVHELVSFIETYENEPAPRSAENIAYVKTVLFFITCFAMGVCMQVNYSRCSKLALRMRAALLTLIYRKALKVPGIQGRISSVVNLVSNDCSRLLEGPTMLMYLWSAPLEAAAIITLLVFEVGVSAVIGAVLLVLLVPLLYATGRAISRIRRGQYDVSDARSHLIHEVVLAIKLVKFYAWERRFAREVIDCRQREMELLKQCAALKSTNLMVVFVAPPVLALAIFAVEMARFGELSPVVAFTTLSLFNTLRFPLVVLPRALKSFVESRAAIERIEKFLCEQEAVMAVVGRRRRSGSSTSRPSTDGVSTPTSVLAAHSREDEEEELEFDTDISVFFDNATIAYGNGPAVLHDVSIYVPRGTTLAVIGPMGSGKSTLLNAIMGEARTLRGDVEVRCRGRRRRGGMLCGGIAYVPQTPWIQSGTVRDNILFGKEFDSDRYTAVVKACALERDIAMLPNGDWTEIGERGIVLSGGQKQRIALARACYSDADVFLLDGVLSAVDSETGRHLVDHVLNGWLAGKTVVMVMQQLHLLPMFHFVVVLKEGRVAFYGKYHNSIVREHFPAIADRVYEQHAILPLVPEEEEGDAEAFRKKLRWKKAERSAAKRKAAKHLIEEGKKETAAYALATEAISAGASAVERTMYKMKLNREVGVPRGSTRQALALWIKSAGVSKTIVSLTIFALAQIARIICDWWISAWTGNEFGLPTDWDYLWIFGVLVGIFAVLCFVRGVVFYRVTISASGRLHNTLFARLMNAPISFFAVMPLGRILNCLSHDIEVTDEGLPDTTHLTIIYLLILLTTLALICIVLPLFIVVALLLGAAFVWLQWLFMRAIKELKSVSAGRNGPIFAQVSESLVGVAVLRAFGRIEMAQQENATRVDRSNRALFTLDQFQLWLSFRLDLIGAVLVLATSLYCVGWRHEIGAPHAGLAVSNALQMLVFFTWVVKGFAEVQALLASIDRIGSFSAINEQESTIPTMPANAMVGSIARTLPSGWPIRGTIAFENVVMSYFPDAPPILRYVSFEIRSGEKVGVVGRTGAGKTSLLVALFRLCPLTSGRILIDDVDIATLNLFELRSRLAIIPQDPVLFQGTVRSNLDPFRRYTDDELWSALALAHLKDDIKKMPNQLETVVAENGSNFSLGQQQLFCLARALLNQSRILVLDEATAAADLETDLLVRKTIAEAFRLRTVLTVAHRLDTVINSDRILVMEDGQVVEFGTPRDLLSNPYSSFSRLVDYTGASAPALRAAVGLPAHLPPTPAQPVSGAPAVQIK